MLSFEICDKLLEEGKYKQFLKTETAGGFVFFGGRVKLLETKVRFLEYEVYEEISLFEGKNILAEACEKFSLNKAKCVHRAGKVFLGEVALWVGVCSLHRTEAFLGCAYIVDEIKKRLAIWKKEHYENGSSIWVNLKEAF